MTADLAAGADQRAATAALLGWLLLEEPGPALAPLVAGVADLAPLGSADPALRSAYAEVLLRRVSPYESAFTRDDGQRGGAAAAALAERYATIGFDEAASGRWRTAGPDHLGLELRAYAVLCASEAAAWRAGRPERAAATVDAERAFLADHLLRWADAACDAIATAAGAPASSGGAVAAPTEPYARLAEVLRAFVAAEGERLNPAPCHPGVQAFVPPAAPERLGPARLAMLLLAPARCGGWLDSAVVARAARARGVPWRSSDPRGRLRQVLEAAADGGDLPDLLIELRPTLAGWAELWRQRAAARPGAARLLDGWRLRVEAALAVLDGIVAAGGLAAREGRRDETGRLLVHAADAAALHAALDAARQVLEAAGCTVETEAAPPG